MVKAGTGSQTRTALLLIDWINDLEFPGGEKLLKKAKEAAEATARLKEQARAENIPVIYANDNFGRWQSDFRTQVDRCLTEPVRGRPLAELLKPDQEDYFILKPMHSAFFATPIDLLLDRLEVRHLILTGLATNICVLFTAHDAYMRGYTLAVPPDCVAAEDDAVQRASLDVMARSAKADTQPSNKIDFRQRDQVKARAAQPRLTE